MKIFVTGSTGFIGKHLVRKLIEENHNVTVNLHGNKNSLFDNKVNKYRLNEDDIRSDINFFKAQAFNGIIHLASLYLTNHKSEEAVKLIDSNIRFSTHVLECACNAGVPWFINTGTFWQHYQNKDYSPVNLYAATKQAFESIAQYFAETNQIKFCTIKICDSYGPEDTRTKIFSLWKRIVKTGEKLNMSPGDQLIDITHVYDIVSAFYLLAQHLQNNTTEIKNGDVFAVMAQKRYTLKELAKIFEQTTGKLLNINWGGLSYKERELMVPWNNGKVIPGWSQKFTLEDGIKSLIE